MIPAAPNTDAADYNCGVEENFSLEPALTPFYDNHRGLVEAVMDLYRRKNFPVQKLRSLPCHWPLYLAPDDTPANNPPEERPRDLLLVIVLKEEDRNRWTEVDGEIRQLVREHGLDDYCFVRYYLQASAQSERPQARVRRPQRRRWSREGHIVTPNNASAESVIYRTPNRRSIPRPVWRVTAEEARHLTSNIPSIRDERSQRPSTPHPPDYSPIQPALHPQPNDSATLPPVAPGLELPPLRRMPARARLLDPNRPRAQGLRTMEPLEFQSHSTLLVETEMVDNDSKNEGEGGEYDRENERWWPAVHPR